jgi:Spy/CpxP family protein refolding chaperone
MEINDFKKGRTQMKKYLVLTITFILALGLMQSASFADKGKWPDRGKGHEESIDSKFFKKVKMIYRYKDELNISEEQLDQIKKLKIALKKDMIRSRADIDIIGIDIRSLLYEDVIDIRTANKLIDKKYEIKKSRMKNIIKSYAELKKVLTKEQFDKLKDIARRPKTMLKQKAPIRK